jgi:glutamine cyclotransferase
LKNFLFVFLVGQTLLSCHVGNKPAGEQNSSEKKPLVIFLAPESGRYFTNTEDISLSLKVEDTVSYDSIRVQIDGARIASLLSDSVPLVWNSMGGRVGYRMFEAVLFKNGQPFFTQGQSVFFRSGVPAKCFTYKVKNAYPHDREAYTQGLVIKDGVLYEGTGLYEGQSSLRTADLRTGKVLKSIHLAEDIFGEGVEVFDNKIIQLSWREQKAFLYDKKSFLQLKTFAYPTEGWGITSDGKYLIMSDGSSNLYYMDKDSFKLVKQVEVCDEHGPVTRLNELEYIDNEIWANVYTTDTIVRINPENGVVTAKINMTGLLPNSEKVPETDVLNGIAYDKASGKIFVTGKKWPKLYEITLIPQK